MPNRPTSCGQRVDKPMQIGSAGAVAKTIDNLSVERPAASGGERGEHL